MPRPEQLHHRPAAAQAPARNRSANTYCSGVLSAGAWPQFGSSTTTARGPSINGGRLSADAVQYLLQKYVRGIRDTCPSLKHKHVSPHTLRHGPAMELLRAPCHRKR